MNALVKSESKMMLLPYMADKYALLPDEFAKTVRATCGLAAATPEQFAAFLIVAKEYDLNPLTKEIYAFPGKGGGIVPIVSIDGWVNLVNSHPQCDGFDFEAGYDAQTNLFSYTCTMHRKDRSHPTVVTEYLSECVRSTEPWKMKHRMLRHKALIQAARYAFGFAGIYDEDEGRVIADADALPRDSAPPRNVKTIEHQDLPEASFRSPYDGDTISVIPGDKGATATVEVASENVTAVSVLPAQVPHKIVGGTYEIWATKYIEAVQNEADVSIVYKWIDANAAQLEKLKNGSPDDAARCKAATAKHIEFLKKTAPKDEPPADAMADDPPPKATKPKKGAVPDVKKDYDGWVAFVIKRFSGMEAAEEVEPFYLNVVEPEWANLFPPDREFVQSAMREAEQRLE
jgi:phage recombination protein Bet